MNTSEGVYCIQFGPLAACAMRNRIAITSFTIHTSDSCKRRPSFGDLEENCRWKTRLQEAIRV